MDNAVDVVVIGGGPAGALAAYTAASGGATTVLLEKQSLPRPKLCGGVLTLAALCALPFPVPVQLAGRCFGRARISYGPDYQEIGDGAPFAVGVDRAVFDHYLVQQATAAGATILTNTAAQNVAYQNGQTQVRSDGLTWRAKVAIAADGICSRTGQKINGLRPLQRSAVCLQGEIPWPVLRDKDLLPDGLNIFYGLTPCGYGWVIPSGGTARIGLGGLVHPSWQPRLVYETFLRRLGSPPAAVQGARLPAGRVHRLVADGVILAGDAAGWVDPFTGEGLRYAIMSGQLAGETALTIVKSGQPATAARLMSYEAACAAVFGRELACAFLLARLFGHSPAMLHKVLLRQPAILPRVLNILTGTDSYRRLLAWLLPRLPWYVAKGIMR